ncbi:hypothetical protein RM555_19140 [Micromonospora sp. DSM 115977]|uniref:Uncharacterized protein n=1 Tax=Micromonospora reichwaldensis TaxID=3075516 RepID=A0ABU2WYT2_9ACTN|nr:hypothetical protein [Micromonospora sp. DSM 115977]MDT0531106.1 hypothetical protein [Micromonospora sp. DSM 115977]
MTDPHVDSATAGTGTATAPAAGPDSRRRRRVVVVAAALLGLLLVGAGAVVAYRSFAPPDDEDSGVRACRSAGVLLRGERGDTVPHEDLVELNRLFGTSGHPDLVRVGVTSVGLVERVQLRRGEPGPGADFYLHSLRQALPHLVATCGKHGVTVEA